MQIYTDDIELAKQYASFLAALGGVSITVLTLVLTIRLNTNKPELHSVLVTSLIVATFACFTGAHLMAQTAAFLNKDPSGIRYFLIASANIFIAPVLIIFSLSLLPPTYLPEEVAATQLKAKADPYNNLTRQIARWVFYSVVIGEIAWLVVTLFVQTQLTLFVQTQFSSGVVIILLLAILVGWFWWFLCKQIAQEDSSTRLVKRLHNLFPPVKASFILICIFIASSLVWTVVSSLIISAGIPNLFDVGLFCFSVVLTCASLCGLEVGMMKKGGVLHRPPASGVEPKLTTACTRRPGSNECHDS